MSIYKMMNKNSDVNWLD